MCAGSASVGAVSRTRRPDPAGTGPFSCLSGLSGPGTDTPLSWSPATAGSACRGRGSS